MASTLPRLPVLKALASHGSDSIAVVHSASGRNFTYGSLLRDVALFKDRLHRAAQEHSLSGQRVAFLAENGYDYVGANCTRAFNPDPANTISDSTVNSLL
jgi:malonyl-CoA/methylmalonyl-CoA synthetase